MAITDTYIYFINPVDNLSITINNAANTLLKALQVVDLEPIPIHDYFKNYFVKHHSNQRVIFSLESSASIIYNSIQLKKKPIEDIIFLDYGAGLGTLFLLAGMLPFKKVLYNDYLEDWCNSAKHICNALKENIEIDDFIEGDYPSVIEYAKTNNIAIDIWASRNVIEHVYELNNFYSAINKYNTNCLVYSTTTANYQNVAMRCKHYFLHKKVEKNIYLPQRKKIIQEQFNQLDSGTITEWAKATRGLALEDFGNGLTLLENKKTLPQKPYLSTNTCDCTTGVWAEHLLPKYVYKSMIESADFSMIILPGFWDTHYNFAPANWVTTWLNKLIKLLGTKGYWLSPFIIIIAAKHAKA